MSENQIPLTLEISKECITTLNKRVITRYYVQNLEQEQELTLQHLEQIRDFFTEYIEQERQSAGPKQPDWVN